MSAQCLCPRRVAKPWGRRDLGKLFDAVDEGDDPVGEIWFEGAGDDAALLVKYILTSERLSVQVHPNDAAANAAGHPSGKDEAWVVLSAGEDARLALGLKRATTREAVAHAAVDGTIVDMLDWRTTFAGETIYNRAGTIHAIGADLVLLEVQQNVDVTYRLYDYGRPRSLHLEEAVAVLEAAPAPQSAAPSQIGEGRDLLCEGGKFVLERWRWAGERAVTLPGGIAGWLVPLSGSGQIDGKALHVGECWLVKGQVSLALDADADVLFTYATTQPLPLFGQR